MMAKHYLCVYVMTLFSCCSAPYWYSVCYNIVIMSGVTCILLDSFAKATSVHSVCLLCMLIVIPISKALPDYHRFPADNWTVNEIWWTDGPSPWGQLPCPLRLSGVGVEVGLDRLLPRYTWIPIFSITLSTWWNGEGVFFFFLGWRVIPVCNCKDWSYSLFTCVAL